MSQPTAANNYKLIAAYDGSGFCGWQKCPHARSVEQTLQDSLEKKLQHPITLQAASRTDAGVHALGQVVNFFSPHQLDPTQLCLSLNGLLPPDLRILGAQKMPPSFHPTLDNTGKEYRYKVQLGIHQNPLLRNHAWHVYYPVNLSLVREAAQQFIGTHDFSALCNSKQHQHYESTMRTICSITLHEMENYLEIRVNGEDFLYKMVRNIVGTIIYVGTGNLSIGDIPSILGAGDRRLAGFTVPAQGLTLHRVFYPTDAS